MFYFLMAPFLTYNWLLIVAAVVPAIYLMIKVYKLDRLDKESPTMLRSMVTGGILSALMALVIEKILSLLLDLLVPAGTVLYNVLLYFVVVGFTEEGCKYFMLRRRSWYSVEFNCLYDGVVYAAFTSLGFALWENISYVLHFGFSTALVRAVTAIPGHTCFGVFMGLLYGCSRGYAYLQEGTKSKLLRILCVLIPSLIHGAYDYIASMQTKNADWIFLVFILCLFAVSYLLAKRMSQNDRYFNMNRQDYRFWDM